MAVIRRNIVSGDLEKRILIGLITNDDFCSKLIRISDKHYFKMDYARQVYQWCQEYFKIYKRAPGKEIQNIFIAEKPAIKEADEIIMTEFLSELSEQYSGNKTNNELLFEQSRDYFRERALNLLAEKIQNNVVRGRIDQAEDDVRNFHKVSNELGKWFNPFDASNINQVFSDDESNKLFRFPGDLGEMIGDFERDWLVAFMAPMKRGKSWWLQELVIHALMNRLKAVIFSFEMNKIAVSKRIYKRIAGLAASPGTYKIPVFDCERNQDGSCRKELRPCDVSVKAAGTDQPKEYRRVDGYKPCKICKEAKNGDYRRAYWWAFQEQKKSFDAREIQKRSKHFKMLYGNNLRVMAYPAFSASFDDAERDLEVLANEGFIADVAAFDYFDISNPGAGTSGFSERAIADHVWKRGKGLATKWHLMNATVLQSNRKSISKKSLEQEDTSEDIRKLAHPDVVAAINQTPEEKEMGVSRVNIIVHRHNEFTFSGEVIVLQSFALGQPFLDDEWIKEKG
jgi:hypothetical protein